MGKSLFRMWFLKRSLCLAGAFLLAGGAFADSALFDRARGLLAAGNAKQAFTELAAAERKLAGNEIYDTLLGIAALDSNRPDDAIIAFERVLTVNPTNAGAQLDLARAYFATGALDLADAALQRLRLQNPPTAAQITIDRYLEAIRQRRVQVRAGVVGHVELSMGRDSNLTGVPNNFTQAVFDAFQIPGVQATGNSVKRSDSYFNSSGALEYGHPVGRGIAMFAAAEGRIRNYSHERDFNQREGVLRLGATRNEGETQWRSTVMAQRLKQEAAAPAQAGEAKPTNDRDTLAATLDWRQSLTPRSQVGAGIQLARVEFPANATEDFSQVLASVSYLQAFSATRAPLLYLSAFVSHDDARRKLADGVTDKGKQVVGVKSYGQISLVQNMQGFGQLGVTQRRDTSDFARANTVQKGKDTLSEATIGVLWRFMPQCQVRSQVALSRNDSNIAIYDFNRAELSTAVRCDMR